MAKRLSITEVEQFVDGLDSDGVTGALVDVSNWPVKQHTGGDKIRDQAIIWLELLEERPEQVERARLFVRRTLIDHQGALSDHFIFIKGLN